jgi:hypothetical protein
MKPPRAEAKDLGLTLLSSAVGLQEPEDSEMEVNEKDVKFLVVLGVFAALGIAIVTATHFLQPQSACSPPSQEWLSQAASLALPT